MTTASHADTLARMIELAEIVTAEHVLAWVAAHDAAWRSNDPDAIGRLFSEDGVYHLGPWEGPWRGTQGRSSAAQAIAEAWATAFDPDERFEATPRSGGRRPARRGPPDDHLCGIGREPPTRYDCVWVIDFDGEGRCVEYQEWFVEEPPSESDRALLGLAAMATTERRTAAHLLVDCLAAEGCEYVFSVPGEETMDVLDALSDHPSVRHITTRHEQGAAFMADVYGRLTGRAAVAMATLGPGATNLVTGHRRRLPRPGADGRDHRPGGLRQAPQGGPPGRRHRRHARAGHEVEHARRADRGDPGDRPQGVPGRRRSRSPARPTSSCPRTWRRWPSSPTPRRSIPGQTYFPEPTDEAIAHAADLIAASERPIILAGNGVLRRRASAELRAFARGPPRPGRGDVHGQGRDRRPIAPLADGRRAPGPRPRPVRASIGPTSSSRVGYDLVEYAPAALEPRRPQADRPHRHPAGRGRRRSTGRRSS